LFGVVCAVFVKEMDHKLTNHIAVDLEKVKQMKAGLTDKELEAVKGEGQ
jgi:hypothetical protein